MNSLFGKISVQVDKELLERTVCDASNELEAGRAAEPVSTCWKQKISSSCWESKPGGLVLKVFIVLSIPFRLR